ncbi:MAG: hypothetical protein O7H41_07770 [Planctomycetota bacterium]|nr:hypothetical protein [Planctomycetota bacterium]
MPSLLIVIALALGSPSGMGPLPGTAQESEPEAPPQLRPLPDEGKIVELIRRSTGKPPRVDRGVDYTVFTDQTSLDLPAFRRHLEQSLLQFEKVLQAKLPKAGASLTVIHFREEKEYRRFCESLELETYVIDGFGCYAPRLSFRPVIVHGLMFGTLRHEAVHQFVDRALGPGIRRFPWVSEGLGALFEAYPLEDFRSYRRYPDGRKRILAPDFSLKAFVLQKEILEGTYEIGATIHGILLLGRDRAKYRKWLADMGKRKCAPPDLPRYLGRTWAELSEMIRDYCSKNKPVTR